MLCPGLFLTVFGHPWIYSGWNSSGIASYAGAENGTGVCASIAGCNQRADYTYVEGGAYKVHTEPACWVDARDACEAEGAHLVILNSDKENEVVAKLFHDVTYKIGRRTSSQDPHYAHIGFHGLYKKQQWVTIHGDSLEKAGYCTFSAGQPDGYAGCENCGSIHINGGLNDIACFDKKVFYICELRPIDLLSIKINPSCS